MLFRLSLSSASVALVLLVAPFLPLARADGALGCVTTAAVSAKATGSAAVQRSSQAACVSYCTSSSSLVTYAAYSVGALTGTNNCFCLTDTNTINANAWNVPSNQGLLCTALGVATIVDVRTTFVYSACYAPTSLVSSLVNTVSGTLGVGVSTPDQCFQQCAGSAGAYIAPYVSLLGLGVPTYGCVCAGPGVSISGVAAACGLGNFIAFTHPAAAAASGLARRQADAYTISIAGRKQVLRDIAERATKSVCPKGTKACAIRGAPEAWECVDPLSDLEACGGCPYGDYIEGTANQNATATGLDCTSLPGLLRSSVTCSAGVCQALACKRGWTLLDGVCARL